MWKRRRRREERVLRCENALPEAIHGNSDPKCVLLDCNVLHRVSLHHTLYKEGHMTHSRKRTIMDPFPLAQTSPIATNVYLNGKLPIYSWNCFLLAKWKEKVLRKRHYLE